MNIVQQHFKTKFYLDSERSPRFQVTQVDKALNSAITDIVLDRYHNIRQEQRKYAFQTSQRLRDELYTLVQKVDDLQAQGDILLASHFPDDYMLALIVIANISGQSIHTVPITYDEFSVIELDPFSRPSLTWPQRVYRIESAEGIKIIFGDIGSLVDGTMYYVKKPATVSIGTEVSNGGTTLYPGTSIIAYVDTNLIMYRQSGGTFNYTLKEGEILLIGSVGGEAYGIVDTGIVFTDYVNCDLPEILHEEVCRKAAQILSGNVENYNREASLIKDIKNTEQ